MAATSRGVLGGVDFLRDVYIGKEVKIGPKVVVIGGGNVAYDVARTSVRQKGVESVSLVCMEKFEEMLADRVEIEEGQEEGIERINSFGPHRINADTDGKVKSITFKKCLAVFDSEQQFNPRYDESEVITNEADTVLFSIGQASDITFLDKCGLNIEMTERGMIKVGRDKIQTSVPGLFVAGDLAYGPRLVIDAIASGKKAAVLINEYLSGERVRLNISESHSETYNKEVSCNNVSHPPDFEKIKREQVPAAPVNERLKSLFTPVETGFLQKAAEEQGGGV